MTSRRSSVLVFVAVSSAAIAAQPADPELIPEARKVLAYLGSVYGTKTLSGMSSYGGWRPVFEMTGRAPAIHGEDAFGWNKPKWGESYRRVLQSTIDSTHDWWHVKGGVPQLQFHWGKPGDPNGSAWVGGGKGTGPVDVARTVTPGTTEHKAAMDDLRQTADYLEQLAKARVPVLWRPLHEIDGGWFWWTDKQAPENTAALYRMIFDYFVRERKLHNLIWVFNPGVRAGGLARGATLEEEIAFRKRYYPGDEYVDLAGIDIYPNSYLGYGPPSEDTYPKAFEIMKQVAPGKILALCETAALVDPERLEKEGPKWLYCLPWFVGGQNPPEWIRRTFPHEQYLTLDELPQLVPHNVAPNARLLQPADGEELSGGSVQLRAQAIDRDSNLSGVEFRRLSSTWNNWALRGDDDVSEALADAALLGEGTLAADGTYSLMWQDPPAGLCDVVAVARDAEGVPSVSNIARISIGMENLARGAEVEASSKPDRAAMAVDGDLFSSWNGDKTGPQWLAVDLAVSETVGGVVISWWKAYARSFQVQVSTEGQAWRDVWREEKKRGYHGDSDVIRFEPIQARYVRLLCTEPGTDWGGYNVQELAVYRSIPQ